MSSVSVHRTRYESVTSNLNNSINPFQNLGPCKCLKQGISIASYISALLCYIVFNRSKYNTLEYECASCIRVCNECLPANKLSLKWSNNSAKLYEVRSGSIAVSSGPWARFADRCIGKAPNSGRRAKRAVSIDCLILKLFVSYTWRKYRTLFSLFTID